MSTHEAWLPILHPPFSFWQPLVVSTHPGTSHLDHGLTAGEPVGALFVQESPVDHSTPFYTVLLIYTSFAHPPSSIQWLLGSEPTSSHPLHQNAPRSQYPAKISSAPSTRAAQKLFERSGSWFHEATQSLTFSFHPYMETSGYDLISDPLINYNFSLGYQVKIQPEKQNQ